MNVEAEETFDAIVREVELRVHDTTPQQMANTLWALAKSGRGGQKATDEALFRAVAEKAVQADFKGWTAQNVANTFWAFAKVTSNANLSGRRHAGSARTCETDFFKCVARYVKNGIAREEASLGRVPALGSHSLSKFAWSFATLLALPWEVSHEGDHSNAIMRGSESESEPERIFTDILEQICDAAPASLKEDTRDAQYSHLSFANFTWAFATANLTSPAQEKTFRYIADAVAGCEMDDLTATTVANLTWAFASDRTVGGRPKAYADPVFHAVADGFTSRARELTPQSAAKVLWSFDEQRISSPALFDAVAADIAGRIGRDKKITVDHLPAIITPYAKSGVRAPALYDAVARCACTTVDAAGGHREIAAGSEGEIAPRTLASLAWSFAMAGVASKPLFDMVAATVPAATTFNDIEKAQLHQVALFIEYEAPHLPQPLRTAEDRALCKASFTRRSSAGSYSRNQDKVSDVLRKSLDWAHESEYITDEGLSLDMASPAERVAVEFDGPSHFAATAEGAYVRNGRTLFKQRILEATGWELFSIPWYRYRDIPYSKRADFLRSGLERTRARRLAEAPRRAAREAG